ncbi:hypothetical protein ACUNV4_28220 [Granulosicoccus sp. 3-233]|uniref:hypothetical protein n=1 Tax=Granulosicoccus sp. 3-233 TaxID=3417969 RepID=UPI003D331BE3
MTGPGEFDCEDDPSQEVAQDVHSVLDENCTADVPPKSAILQSIIRSMVRTSTLAGAIRFCGAGMIVFALSLFLMQGVDAANDLQRFLLLLIQTTLLGASGFAVGYLLKEPRGARVFFLIALMSIPANLAVLGGMIYSVVHAGELTTHYPEYANWHASNLVEILTAMASGAVVLAPMAFFAFSVFARQSRVWLTVAYLLGSTVLLLPVRSMLPATLIAALLATALILLIRRHGSSRDKVMTGEERLARLLLFFPPVLILARSATLYASEFSMLVSLFSIVYLLMRFCCKQWHSPSWFANSVHLLTALAATCLAGLYSSLLAIGHINTSVNLSFCLILGALLLDLSRQVSSSSVRWWIHVGWALLCIPALFSYQLFLGGASSLVVTLLIGVLIVGSGVMTRRRLVTAVGILALLGSVLLQGRYMTHMLMTSNWMTLALVGAVIVVTGSLIERYGVSGKLGLQAWLNRPESTQMCQSSFTESKDVRLALKQNDEKRRDMAA